MVFAESTMMFLNDRFSVGKHRGGQGAAWPPLLLT